MTARAPLRRHAPGHVLGPGSGHACQRGRAVDVPVVGRSPAGSECRPLGRAPNHRQGGRCAGKLVFLDLGGAGVESQAVGTAGIEEEIAGCIADHAVDEIGGRADRQPLAHPESDSDRQLELGAFTREVAGAEQRVRFRRPLPGLGVLVLGGPQRVEAGGQDHPPPPDRHGGAHRRGADPIGSSLPVGGLGFDLLTVAADHDRYLVQSGQPGDVVE